MVDSKTINELIDTNPKCHLFFKIDLQEHFAALIFLSADEFCQPFSWGGNFYVDSGTWVTSSQVQARFFSIVGHWIRKVSEIHMVIQCFETVLASVFNFS
jgi:hypothetical protein